MLSFLAEFDDVRRCQDVLIEGSAEEQFLRYVNLQEDCRRQWLGAVQEAQRLQRELDASLQNMADLETKLFHARRLLEMENKCRKEAENERDDMKKEMTALKDTVLNLEMPKDTREKLNFLKTYPKKRHSKTQDDKYGNDINSTGSFLSDLSVTHSEEDFLDIRSSRTWKKHRPSTGQIGGATNAKNSGIFGGNNKSAKCSRISTGRRKSTSQNQQNTSGTGSNVKQHYFEIGKNDHICATTKVTIPSDGPIRTESIIEAIPQSDTPIATTTTGGSNGGTSDDKINDNKENSTSNFLKTPQRFRSPFKNHHYYTPTAPPMSTDFSIFKGANTTSKLNHFKKSVVREHHFTTKTFLKTDNCTNCQKKIRFGSVAIKCKNCRVCVHQDCKDLLTVSCVPPSSGGTPQFKGILGCISDYAPSVSPKIPPIIIYCVHEIETRGLNEVGIYRVSGSEREVKSLKEKFLRGKNVPNLNNIDVHVICGCVKDFLRSLREPLIPTNLWANFSNSTQNSNNEDRQIELFNAIDQLPQSNRDTLAFLILHFQRIAQCIEIKMPIENIARIFGPTIVGYSSQEPGQHAIFTETMIQFQVMESLMHIPGEYWSKFTAIDDDEQEILQQQQQNQNLHQTPLSDGSKLIYATPLKGTLRKERKFYATPPYPYKKK